MTLDSIQATCITLDVDWAPEEVLQSVVGRLESASMPATFFATHESPTLAGLDPGRFEVGLHPNFNASDGDFLSPLASLKAVYPDAAGARSHSLFISSHILERYVEVGLSYEANTFLWRHGGLHPVIRFKDLLSIPFNWSDDKLFELGLDFGVDEVPLNAPGLKVLNFHPIHVAMNTRSLDHYAEFKPHYQDPARLHEFVNREQPGVGTLFDEVLEGLGRQGAPILTMEQVREEYLASEPTASPGDPQNPIL